jgi:hypothetical protein
MEPKVGRSPSDEAETGRETISRRDALKIAGLSGAAALSTGTLSPAQAADQNHAKNPYGGVPSGGITLPPYYRPTPNLASANVYYPGQEELGPDEMRVSFIGSTPIPVTRSQLAHALWLSSAMASASSLILAPDASATSSPWRCLCRWSTISSSLTFTWITTRTCHIYMPSRLGWDAGNRCAFMGHRAARPRTASRR